VSYNDKQTKKILDMFDELMNPAGIPGKEKEGTEEVESMPYQILSFPEEEGSETWLLNPVSRQFVRAFNHTEVVQITQPDKDNKVIVRTPGGFLQVTQDYVRDIGFN